MAIVGATGDGRVVEACLHDRYEIIIDIIEKHCISGSERVYGLIEFDEEKGYRDTVFTSNERDLCEIKYKDAETRLKRGSLNLP